ncbi:MAG TPA: hypothetical protein VIJ62_00720 [Rhizomicrobium sp.]
MNRAYRRRPHAALKWQLLTSACAMALCVCASGEARAFALSDIGQFSLSAGGMWDQTQGDGADWSAEHFLTKAAPDFSGPGIGDFRITPPLSWDYDAQASFEPADTVWVFSAAVRYGRSRATHGSAYKTFPTSPTGGGADAVQPAAAGANHGNYTGSVTDNETHMFADFSVGRDFGIGLWDGDAKSIVSLGARYVRFSGHSAINFKTVTKYKTEKGTRLISRGFTGVGPRLSWDGEAPIWRHIGLYIDAGADAAMLFGRQSVDVDSAYTAAAGYAHERRKSAIVNNFGGYAALSWNPWNLGAKVSVGYRADLFFHVLDGGDAAKHEIDRSFYGPFASIGIQTR